MKGLRSATAKLTVPVLLALLTGCAGHGLPNTHYYTLRPPSTLAPPPAGSAARWTVGVVEPAVDAPYDQDRMVYRLDAASHEIGTYAYHRWAAPLAQLVAVALAEGLRGLEGVAIEPARPGVAYGARLEGRLLYLEELERAGERLVRLGLDLRLIDAGGAALWSAEIRTEAGGEPITGSEVMLGLRQAVDQAVREARSGVSGALGALR